MLKILTPLICYGILQRLDKVEEKVDNLKRGGRKQYGWEKDIFKQGKTKISFCEIVNTKFFWVSIGIGGNRTKGGFGNARYRCN